MKKVMAQLVERLLEKSGFEFLLEKISKVCGERKNSREIQT